MTVRQSSLTDRPTEQHLEKTPIGYIQWRFQAGHDKEILEKVTRVLTAEDKEMMEKDWVGRNGEKRKIEVPGPFFSSSACLQGHT